MQQIILKLNTKSVKDNRISTQIDVHIRGHLFWCKEHSCKVMAV